MKFKIKKKWTTSRIIFLTVITSVLVSYSLGAYAKNNLVNETTQIGRYLSIPNKPNKSQLNLLSQTIQVRFPQSVQTVGEAMNYLLRFSGYSLVDNTKMSQELKIIISKPLPIVDRELGPVSLKDGLATLMGPAFYLIQDPINRIVDFRLKTPYAKIFSKQSRGG